MTTLIAWVGADSHGPSSAYLASDSRISWEAEGWNSGKKVFASSKFPEIFGYCGDVTFPSMCLSQLIDCIDNGVVISLTDIGKIKHEKIFKQIKIQFGNYPISQRREFHILHFSRTNVGIKSIFSLNKISWRPNAGWSNNEIQIPETSDLISYHGSGSRQFFDSYIEWKESPVGGTSRSIFSAFCDAIAKGEDPKTGGAPQLVGLYRISPGKIFGIISGNERYLNGAPVPDTENFDGVEWRNSLFEVCAGDSMNRKKLAQPQPRPFPEVTAT